MNLRVDPFRPLARLATWTEARPLFNNCTPPRTHTHTHTYRCFELYRIFIHYKRGLFSIAVRHVVASPTNVIHCCYFARTKYTRLSLKWQTNILQGLVIIYRRDSYRPLELLKPIYFRHVFWAYPPSWFNTFTPRMCSRVRAQAAVVYQASGFQCGAPGNDSCRERVFSETLWVIEKND